MQPVASDSDDNNDDNSDDNSDDSNDDNNDDNSDDNNDDNNDNSDDNNDNNDEPESSEPSIISKPASERYHYNRAIFDVEDSSDDEQHSTDQLSSLSLPSQHCKSDDELEEERILSIAKNVLCKEENKASKPKKVSESVIRAERGKELATIRSESQRRVREGPISLPYHRPKQRSLQEFLSRKKNEIIPLPVGRCGLKMSMKNMQVLRQIEVRKKEAVEFYKSESEAENSDEEWKPNREETEEHGKEQLTKCIIAPSTEEKTVSIVCSPVNNIVSAEDPSVSEDEMEATSVKPLPDIDDLPALSSKESLSNDLSTDLDTVINEYIPMYDLEENNLLKPVQLKDSSSETLEQLPAVSECPLSESSNLTASSITHFPNNVRPFNEQTREQEDDRDEFLTNMNEEVSPPAAGRGSRLETQDLLDEDMPELLLEEGPEDEINDSTNETNEQDDSLQISKHSSVSLHLQRPLQEGVISRNGTLNSDEGILQPQSTPTALPPKLSRLAAKLGAPLPLSISTTPRLTPGSKHLGMIDLDTDFASPAPPDPGLVDLKNRFALHSASKLCRKKPEQVSLGVVSKEKDSQGNEQLVMSSVLVNLEGEPDSPLAQCTTPGAKLQFLKDSLRAKMTERRARATREKQMQKDFLETEEVQKLEDPFALPDDEEEAELTESSEGESEPELEDDVDMTDKPRTKSKFLEDEAEVDEDEEIMDEAAGIDGEDDRMDDYDSNNECSDSDEEVVMVRKPSKKSKNESRRKALLLDSDEEEGNSDEMDGTVGDGPSKSPVQVDLKEYSECHDDTMAVNDNLSKTIETSQTVADDDLPDTQPISSPNKKSPNSSHNQRESIDGMCCSLDDSSSLELQGSCLPAHQPVRTRRPAHQADLQPNSSERGSLGLGLGLDFSSTDLWCAGDNSSSKASNARFPSSTLLPLADYDGIDATAEKDVTRGNFSTSQELRLDFRGLTGSQEPRNDGELPDLLSGRFTGATIESTERDDGTNDIGSLMELCTGQFTDAISCSPPAIPLTLSDEPPPLTLPDVPFSLPVNIPSTGELALGSQLVTSPSHRSAFEDTVVLAQDSQTQIGLSASITSPLGPEQDELLDLCSGDFTELVSQKKKAANKAPVPAGQAKLTNFFTRAPPKKRTHDDDGGNRQLGSTASAGSAQTKTVLLSLTAPDMPEIISSANETKQQSLSQNNEHEKIMVNDESNSDLESLSADKVESDDGNEVDVSRKKRRRIVLLDDGDDDEEDLVEESGQIITEAKDASDDEEEGDLEQQGKVILYDDDENEVPVKFPAFKDREKGGIRADFLENEAELSGSEVESDEEEQEDDDLMDEEEGDKEHFDEEQLREQIGQTHVRGELARDQREVRLLQELYLEDGDLHGEGRQRTFRWKNLNDDEGDDGPRADDSDEADAEDDEESSQWRKERHERELFMNKKNETGEDDDADLTLGLTAASGLLKTTSIPVISKTRLLSKAAVENSATNGAGKKPLMPANPEGLNSTSISSNPLILARQSSLPGQLTKCGSFLSRGASKLARLASLIKERNDGSRNVAATANAGGSFIFHSVTAEEAHRQRHGSIKSNDCAIAEERNMYKKRPASNTASPSQNLYKKPRLDRTLRVGPRLSNSSIFKHF
ncbi:uncharacterized protein LOC108669649 [Hyalella azteca]|uniref:Uncharacterized protein LOC108669649 n=1 Tax=Hyalella azteca TaxID=294128 RepID=A0A8B7NFY4_HYAAZ|nr:uncharacterized protein LOC108669649 [Hyalella azteca]